jgi:hypothetical protein
MGLFEESEELGEDDEYLMVNSDEYDENIRYDEPEFGAG